MRGDIEAARDDLRRAHTTYEEFGYRNTLTRDFALAATDVDALAVELQRVEPLLRQACAALERDGDSAWIAMHAAALAEIACETDRADEAIALSGRAMELAPRGDIAGQVASRRARARALTST